MPYREYDSDNEQTGARVNPEYAAFQLARALTTAQEHGDSATRRRAEEKIAKWATVLRSILDGTIKYGSRTPLNEIPGWATLDVVTEGFATGRLLAGGPVQDHEKKLLERQPRQAQEGRGALNAYYPSDEGFSELLERLRTGCYEVTVPDEGALMVVAWLAKHGNAEDARALLEQISPFFSDLRFYPVPIDKPHRGGASVHIQDVGQAIASLRRIKPNKSILAQKESVEIWAPYHDRVVALFLKTLRDDSPCENYPVGWRESALALLSEYSELRKKHQLCGKPEKPSGHAARLSRHGIYRANATAINRMVTLIQLAALKDWRAAAWFLERRFSKDWGRVRAVSAGESIKRQSIASRTNFNAITT